MLKNRFIILGFVFILLNGCGKSITAPHDAVPKRKSLPTDAFGGWISVTMKSSQKSFQGELIAINADSIYVMNNGKVQLEQISDVNSARIVLFKTSSEEYALWTFLGSLGTISNGAFLVFTFPLTLITGIATTSSESNRINYLDYPQNNWEELMKYARFPQGLPQGLNVGDLKPRSIIKQK